MDQPISLDAILNDFDDSDEVWLLQDSTTGLYVIVPDDRFPGRRPIRFFLKSEDASSLLVEIVKVNPKLASRTIQPIKVNLKRAIRGIAADKNPNHADSFVLHGPNEVLAWVAQQ